MAFPKSTQNDMNRSDFTKAIRMEGRTNDNMKIQDRSLQSSHCTRTHQPSTKKIGRGVTLEMKGIRILVYGLISLSKTWVLMFFKRSSI